MEFMRLSNMKNGWFVGDFLPTAWKSSTFEVGYLKHAKNEFHASHYHKVATEINLLVKGRMKIIIESPDGTSVERFLRKGDIFIIYPDEISRVQFLTDCELVVIKDPSLPGDKYIVDEL